MIRYKYNITYKHNGKLITKKYGIWNLTAHKPVLTHNALMHIFSLTREDTGCRSFWKGRWGHSLWPGKRRQCDACGCENVKRWGNVQTADLTERSFFIWEVRVIGNVKMFHITWKIRLICTVVQRVKMQWNFRKNNNSYCLWLYRTQVNSEFNRWMC